MFFNNWRYRLEEGDKMNILKQLWQGKQIELSVEAWQFFVWFQVILLFLVLITTGGSISIYDNSFLLLFILAIMFPVIWGVISVMFLRPDIDVADDKVLLECLRKIIHAGIVVYIIYVFFLISLGQ